MKHAAALAILMSLPASVGLAQDQNDRGLSLMERGAQMFMEGILKEMEPALKEFEGFAEDFAPALRQFAQEMGPKLTELLEEVEDWSAYDAPEILPNGDIIIRRKPDHPMAPPETPTEPAPQIEL